MSPNKTLQPNVAGVRKVAAIGRYAVTAVGVEG